MFLQVTNAGECMAILITLKFLFRVKLILKVADQWFGKPNFRIFNGMDMGETQTPVAGFG
eukprot:gene17576-20971_t